MNTAPKDYARVQADGLDNIAPTMTQGQRAWQYAQSDNFFSPEEQADVMRQQLEPYRAAIEAKLTQIGYDPDYFAQDPRDEAALHSGQQTGVLVIRIAPEINIEGRLRIVMTDEGPDIRFTPSQRTLTIPDEIGGIRLSQAEQNQLVQEGALPRPFMIQDNGEYVPTYLRLDQQSNTVELWHLRPEQLPTKLMGIDLTKDQQLQLVNGYDVRINGLLDSQGEPFNATVNLSAARQSLQFSNFNRLDVAVKPDSEFRQQLVQNDEGAKTDLNRSREISVGSPVVNHQQSEVIKQLLDTDPHEENTKKLRLH